MAAKEWSLENLLRQLDSKATAAGIGSIFDEKAAGSFNVTDLISELKEADFQKRFRQLQGQQVMHVDVLGNVTPGDAPAVEAQKQAKAQRTGTRVPEADTEIAERETHE